jgi:hypothetical protein
LQYNKRKKKKKKKKWSIAVVFGRKRG